MQKSPSHTPRPSSNNPDRATATATRAHISTKNRRMHWKHNDSLEVLHIKSKVGASWGDKLVRKNNNFFIRFSGFEGVSWKSPMQKGSPFTSSLPPPRSTLIPIVSAGCSLFCYTSLSLSLSLSPTPPPTHCRPHKNRLVVC